MAEQIKYISENGKLYLDETKPIIESLCSKLKEMGAEGKTYSGLSSGEFIFDGIYEFPRKGTVIFNFKEFAKRPGAVVNLPEEFDHNIIVSLLGFKEDTKKYQEMRSSIENILLTEAFDKIE